MNIKKEHHIKNKDESDYTGVKTQERRLQGGLPVKWKR